MRIWIIITLLGILVIQGFRAAEIKLAWDANPAEEQVTLYEVKATEVFGVHEVSAKTDGTSLTLAGLNGGSEYFFKVRAENAVGTSEWSPAIMSMPLPDATLLTLQVSTDLKTWKDIAVFYDPKKPAAFYRVKVEVQP